MTGRLLGIDYGERRVGVAVSDPQGLVATPAGTLNNTSPRKTAAAVAELCHARKVHGVVVGLPLNMDGRHGPAADRVKAFVDLLRRRVDLPVITWDERMSTQAASRALREGGLRARKQRVVIDQVAAQIILQHYLDTQAARTETDEPTR